MPIKYIEMEPEIGKVRVTREDTVSVAGSNRTHVHDQTHWVKHPTATLEGNKIKLTESFRKNAKVKVTTGDGEVVYQVKEDDESAAQVAAQVAGTILAWDQAPDADVIEETPSHSESYVVIRGGISVTAVSLEDHERDPLPSDVSAALASLTPDGA